MNPRLRSLLLSSIIALWLVGCGHTGTKNMAPAPVSGAWTQFRLNRQHNAVLPGSLRVSWRLETHGAFSSSPAIVGSTIYIGNNIGVLYALDVRTGRPRWQFHVKGPLMSNPLLYHGTVFVGEGNSGMPFGRYPFMVGSGENSLVAVDATTGRQKWRVPLKGSGMPTGAIIDGALVHHDGKGTIVIVDPDSGRIISSIEAQAIAAMTAIAPMGHGRFVTSGGVPNLVQMRSLPTAGVVWSTMLPFLNWTITDCPIASDGKRVFCDYNVPPDLRPKYYSPPQPAQLHAYAIDAQTGTLTWDTTLERGTLPKENSSAIPLVHDGRVYFGSAIAPYVHCLLASRGRLEWRLRVHGAVKGGIAEKDGVLYFGDLRGYLWAVDAKSGKIIGNKNLHTSFNVGSPVIDGKTLMIGSKTGSVIAIPLDAIRAAKDG